MTRPIARLFTMVVLLLSLVVVPRPARAAGEPGVSVAPQAGAPGTQFEIQGAGLQAGGKISLTIVRGGGAGQSMEATADSAGRFRLTLDSTGFEEADYTLTIGGTASVTTRFAVAANQPERCFSAETGFCIRGRFLDYWTAQGGLAINGYPLSAEFNEVLSDGKPYTVQYFERTRLEYHPEMKDTQYQVLIGQFGRQLHPADPPAVPNTMQTWFPQTGHNVPSDFYTYWTSNGGLTQFGLPLSEPFQQTLDDGKTYRVQYFERARFESHPENPAPYTILLGQFGRMILKQVQR